MKDDKCEREGREFKPGSMVCDGKLCYKCEDGIWEKKGALSLDGDAMSQL